MLVTFAVLLIVASVAGWGYWLNRPGTLLVVAFLLGFGCEAAAPEPPPSPEP